MAGHVIGRLEGDGWKATLTSEGWECSTWRYKNFLRHYEPDNYALWADDAKGDQRAWGVGALIAAGKALKARVFIRKELLRDRQAEAFARDAGKEQAGG